MSSHQHINCNDSIDSYFETDAHSTFSGADKPDLSSVGCTIEEFCKPWPRLSSKNPKFMFGSHLQLTDSSQDATRCTGETDNLSLETQTHVPNYNLNNNADDNTTQTNACEFATHNESCFAPGKQPSDWSFKSQDFSIDESFSGSSTQNTDQETQPSQVFSDVTDDEAHFESLKFLFTTKSHLGKGNGKESSPCSCPADEENELIIIDDDEEEEISTNDMNAPELSLMVNSSTQSSQHMNAEVNELNQYQLERNRLQRIAKLNRQLADYRASRNSVNDISVTAANANAERETRDENGNAPNLRDSYSMLHNYCNSKGFLSPKIYVDALGYLIQFNNSNRENERIASVDFLCNEVFPASDDEISQFDLSTKANFHADGDGKLFSIMKKNSYVPEEQNMKEIMITHSPAAIVISIDNVEEFTQVFRRRCPHVMFDSNVNQTRQMFLPVKSGVNITSPKVAQKHVLESLRACKNLVYLKIIRTGQNKEKDYDGMASLARKLEIFQNLDVQEKHLLQLDIAVEFGFDQNPQELKYPQYRCKSTTSTRQSTAQGLKITKFAGQCWQLKNSSAKNYTLEGGINIKAKNPETDHSARELPLIGPFSVVRSYLKPFHGVKLVPGSRPSRKMNHVETYKVEYVKRFLLTFEKMLQYLRAHVNLIDLLQYRVEFSYRAKLNVEFSLIWSQLFSFRQIFLSLVMLFKQMEDTLGIEPLVNAEELPRVDRILSMAELCITECRQFTLHRSFSSLGSHLSNEEKAYFRCMFALAQILVGVSNEKARQHISKYFHPMNMRPLRRHFHKCYNLDLGNESVPVDDNASVNSSMWTPVLHDDFMLPFDINDVYRVCFRREPNTNTRINPSNVPTLEEINQYTYEQDRFYRSTSMLLNYYFNYDHDTLVVLASNRFGRHPPGRSPTGIHLMNLLHHFGTSIPHSERRKERLVELMKQELPRIVHIAIHRLPLRMDAFNPSEVEHDGQVDRNQGDVNSNVNENHPLTNDEMLREDNLSSENPSSVNVNVNVNVNINNSMIHHRNSSQQQSAQSQGSIHNNSSSNGSTTETEEISSLDSDSTIEAEVCSVRSNMDCSSSRSDSIASSSTSDEESTVSDNSSTQTMSSAIRSALLSDNSEHRLAYNLEDSESEKSDVMRAMVINLCDSESEKSDVMSETDLEELNLNNNFQECLVLNRDEGKSEQREEDSDIVIDEA